MATQKNAARVAVQAELCRITGKPDIKPLDFTRVGATWKGEPVTNTQAKLLISQLREWLLQFQAPEAFALLDAVQDFERLFAQVWTEIDESLSLLHRANLAQDPETTAKHLSFVAERLHRWQDRGGRIGNAE
ncbi:hypothetical protein [Delftia tsuruhatensis]|uniref:hypothetical protein n=1 Tax=Delftia tsuruhatensis TaxID=180282 RepID=UPI0030D37CF9